MNDPVDTTEGGSHMIEGGTDIDNETGEEIDTDEQHTVRMLLEQKEVRGLKEHMM